MKNKFKYNIFEWIKTISFSLILSLTITYFLEPTTVNGYSMTPTLTDKDYLIVNKLEYVAKMPKRGDVIVFKSKLTIDNTNKKKNLVKRVIGLPGEHIKITNNKVYINDIHLNESYLEEVNTDGSIDITIPDNNIFIMGDNRSKSLDSRSPEVGTVNLEDIVGKVIIRLYPFDRFGSIYK